MSGSFRIAVREPMERPEVWPEVWRLMWAESHQRGLGHSLWTTQIPRWPCGEGGDGCARIGGAPPLSSHTVHSPLPFSIPFPHPSGFPVSSPIPNLCYLHYSFGFGIYSVSKGPWNGFIGVLQTFCPEAEDSGTGKCLEEMFTVWSFLSGVNPWILSRLMLIQTMLRF